MAVNTRPKFQDLAGDCIMMGYYDLSSAVDPRFSAFAKDIKALEAGQAYFFGKLDINVQQYRYVDTDAYSHHDTSFSHLSLTCVQDCLLLLPVNMVV